MPSLPFAKTIFVWDFDWTIVNCNSDEYIPSQFLGDEQTCSNFRSWFLENGADRWHECVAAQINASVQQKGLSRDDIFDAAASMPYLIDVRGALGDVADAKQKKMCGQMILSDGNDWFIDAFVRRNGMKYYFTHGIETNHGSWGDENDVSSHDASDVDGAKPRSKAGAFSVSYQSAKYGGHSCQTCPPNLCKSQVLRDVLSRIEPLGAANHADKNNGTTSRPARPRIVYVGDGSNDACPALNVMTEGDVLLARGGRKRRDPNSKSGPESDGDSAEGHGQHDFHPEMHSNELEAHCSSGFGILSALRKAKVKEGLVPRCKVSVWRSGKELRSLIRSLLSEA